ncbi:Serine/threonine-protein kinase PknB [Roseimaritima multifibrata]|uniref:Serine/threonine-protein kinase PknB n=1 Tax=Roseimaritima multifibrata TaxID=1930274 RepID=A0A517MBN9_9BACT|nr:hypothetical protein [Roseimaritima multifibrata]QDS92300.1 Serine/threonine-protein kinase PknB [Roseimaritima multifibrata]
MSPRLSVNEFWNRLTESGLADAERCRRWAVEYAKKNSGRPPADSATLAKFLIRGGALTSYQVQCLLAGNLTDLSTGRYVLRRPAEAPWIDWFWAKQARGRGEMLVHKQPADTPEIAQRWLTLHLSLRSKNLQPLESERNEGETLVVSRLPPGRTLAEAFASGQWDPARTAELGEAVANALLPLHHAGYAHGGIHPERIWIGKPTKEKTSPILLLRDAPLGIDHPLGERSVWLRRPEQPALYAAPEFSLPGQPVDPLSDQYALGCLLYQSQFGTPPFSADNSDALLQQHIEKVPAKLQALANGSEKSGSGIVRVIGHAMAKNAAARFTNLDGMIAALQQLQEPNEIAAAAATPTASAPIPTPIPTPKAPPAKPDTVVPASRKTASPVAEPPRHQKQPVAPVPASAPPTQRVPPAEASPAKQTPAAKPAASSPEPVSKQPQAPKALKPTPKPQAASPANPSPSPTPAETNAPPKRKRAGSAGRRRKKSKKSYRGPIVIGGLGFAAMIGLILILGRPSGPSKQVSQTTPAPFVPTPRAPAASPSANGSGAGNGNSAGENETMGPFELTDNEKTLWAPPSVPDPPPLEMIPGGPQMVIVLRLSDLVQSPTGQAISNAFSQELGDALENLTQRTKIPAEDIERLTLAFDGQGEGVASITMGIHLQKPRPLKDLLQTWKVEIAQTPEGDPILAGDGPDAFFVRDVSEGAMVDAFSIGSIEQMKGVAEMGGAPIPLPPQLKGLWQSANSEADLNLLLLPNYLFADGRNILKTYAPQIIGPLREFLQPDANGVLLVSNLEPDWYLETRMLPGPGTTSTTLSRKMQTTVAQLPTWAENFLVDTSPDPSWRKLANRMPQMLRAIDRYARYGVAEDAATANLYLPSEAAPNILLASMLAANTLPGKAAAIAATPMATKAMSIEELLEMPISVSFDQESLEFAGQAVIDEVKGKAPPGTTIPPYVLLGGDLQKEGITQNQQIRDFKIKDQPLRKVLTLLVMQANIDKSVTDASQPQQLLVWVIGDNPNKPGEKAILISTRAGAEGKYELPAEFVP